MTAFSHNYIYHPSKGQQFKPIRPGFSCPHIGGFRAGHILYQHLYIVVQKKRCKFIERRKLLNFVGKRINNLSLIMPKVSNNQTKTTSPRYPLRNKNVKIYIPNSNQPKKPKHMNVKRKIIKKARKQLIARRCAPVVSYTGKAKQIIATRQLVLHCGAPMQRYITKARPIITKSTIIPARKSKIRLAIRNSSKTKSDNKSKDKNGPKSQRTSARLQQSRALQKLKRFGIGQPINIGSSRRKALPTATKQKQQLKRQSTVKRSKSTSKSTPKTKPSKNQVKNKLKLKKPKYATKTISVLQRSQIKMETPSVRLLPPPIPRRTAAINHLYVQESGSNSMVPSNAADQQSRGDVRLKSIAEIQRINRSRQQRIFLLSAERVQNSEWIFKIIGTRGQIYTTKIFTVAKCTCFDFRSQRKPCKHIYFIITQIAQNQAILEGFNSKGSISQTAFDELNECLCKRLKARIAGTKPQEGGQQIDLKDDKDCVICYTEMNQKEEVLDACSTCKKYFHRQCIKQWRAHNNTCPLCRSEFESSKTEADPLEKFEELKI